MIKLKDILKEEMSPREKREFEAAFRGIETNISFISQEANRLIKLLNKQGLKAKPCLGLLFLNNKGFRPKFHTPTAPIFSGKKR